MARHNTNHVRLSRAIDDPAANSTTDGSEVTAALRNDYLNRANNFIQLTIMSLVGGDWANRREKFVRYAQGLVKSQTITWSASGTAVGAADPNGFFDWLECRDSTHGLLTPHFSKAELDTNVNPNIPNAFVIFNSLIYGYGAGANLTSGATGTLYYVTSDIQTTTDATPNLDAKWDDTLIELAVMFYKQDKGEFDDARGHLQAASLVFERLRGM